MTYSGKQGFTVIETMLFFGITGLMVVGILVGIGTTVNAQNYKESLNSLKGFLQKEYGMVEAVSNSRSATVGCSASGISGSSPQPSGRTNCVVLGRYITTTDNPDQLAVRSVVGLLTAPQQGVQGNDIQTLKQYRLFLYNFDNDDDHYRADTAVRFTNDRGAPSVFSVLIIRVPGSGAVRTFIDPSRVVRDRDILTDLVTASALSEPLYICVRPDGFAAGPIAAVGIVARATSASGVEIFGESLYQC
jgi:hypothetical protein